MTDHEDNVNNNSFRPDSLGNAGSKYRKDFKRNLNYPQMVKGGVYSSSNQSNQQRMKPRHYYGVREKTK